MPGEDHVDRPSIPSKMISSDDIEPPTTITDPKLKKKLRKMSLQDSNSGSAESSVGSSDEYDDEDEGERRGRSRTIDTLLGMQKEGGNQGGLPGNQNFIFMGDFVDRGYFSLETLSLLLCLKARYTKPPPTSCFYYA